MSWRAMRRRDPWKITVKVFDNRERMIYRDGALEVTNPEKGVSSLTQYGEHLLCSVDHAHYDADGHENFQLAGHPV